MRPNDMNIVQRILFEETAQMYRDQQDDFMTATHIWENLFDDEDREEVEHKWREEIPRIRANLKNKLRELDKLDIKGGK